MAEFFLRRMSTALSMLPSASVRAALQSIMGALVRSRRVFTAAAEIVLIDLSCPKKSVWNFQALKTSAFPEAGEFQTPFLDKASIKNRGEAQASPGPGLPRVTNPIYKKGTGLVSPEPIQEFQELDGCRRLLVHSARSTGTHRCGPGPHR